MNKLKRFFTVSSLLAFPIALISGTPMVFAATAVTPPITTLTGTSGLEGLFCNIIGYFFWFVIVLSVIMALVAAFDYVTAGDDTEKTTRGRKRLTYAAVGVLVALLAFAIPTLVGSLFSTNPISKLDPTTCAISP
jgi:uncharacterized membrane protein